MPRVVPCPDVRGHLPAAVRGRPLAWTGTAQAHRGSRRAEVVHRGKPLWRRSSRCGNESDCVEVAVFGDRVLARDSKEPCCSPVQFTAPVWARFLHAVIQDALEH
ncbi:DUF397 domain-containing protein [Streptomyces sp. NPDC005760]